MTKPHATLSPKTNIILIIVWGMFIGFLLFTITPQIPFTLALAGGVLGAVGGVMQHLAFKQSTANFASASSLMGVRGAFKATTWGRRYLFWIYFTKVFLAVLAFALIRKPLLQVILGYLTGYLSFMFIREIVTLKDTFRLRRLAINSK